MSHTATCERDGHADPVGTLVEDPIGTRVVDPAGGPAGTARRGGRWSSLADQPEVRWAALSLVLFLIGLAVRAGGGGWVADVLFAGCYAAGGWEPGLAGLQALRDRSLDVDLLMVVAALVAAGIGQVLDGALLIVIFSTSGALEAVSTRRTRDAVTSLLSLAPEVANRLGPDGQEVVDAAALTVGDRIMVRPGERIAADGRVVAGSSDVDQASITGEPLPVSKTPGEEVFAGTLNGSGALVVEVTRPAGESVVARIVALVEEASETKAQTQLFVDRVEQRYSIAMVTVTLALFLVPLILGSALQPTLLRAMTFMIVASPCAVVLATMPPYLAAIANAGRHGVLVKSAVVMEQLGQTSRVAFDKTGTLTRGAPRLEDVSAVNPAVDADTVLSWAAAAEHPSEHPLARAVVDAARERGLALPVAAEFASAPGRGVQAMVAGRSIRVGRPDILEGSPAGPAVSDARTAVADLEESGRTAVVVLADGQAVGVLGLADELRPDARAAVARLAEVTAAPAVLVTGDNRRAAAAVAAAVGIGDVRSGLLPEGKVAAVEDLQGGGARLAVVGDGVNDAPALAAAHLGVAMGRHGSDLALETADVVMVRDELSALPAAINISRRARRVVKVNLAFAATVIAALVCVDLAGHLPLPLGVAGHEGSTVVVGLNGLRLLRRRHWQP